MKNTGIYIDYKNKEQVKWWNNFASKLVGVSFYAEIYNEFIETATSKPVGILLNLKGPFKKFIIKKNLKFIENPVTFIKK